MRYQFESKIAVEVSQKKSILQKLCITGGILAIVCTLVTIIIDGLSGVSFLPGIFVPVFLLWTGFGKRMKIDYVPTEVVLDIFERRIVISYPSVRRHLNGSSVSEIIEFNSDDIKNFQYSSELKALRFYGFPEITISGKKDESKDKLCEKVVYLPADEAEMICTDIEKHLGISAERMEQTRQ